MYIYIYTLRYEKARLSLQFQLSGNPPFLPMVSLVISLINPLTKSPRLSKKVFQKAKTISPKAGSPKPGLGCLMSQDCRFKLCYLTQRVQKVPI